ENAVHVLTRRVAAVVTVERRLRHVDFHDTEALTARPHREEAVFGAIERNLFQHPAFHGLCATTQVLELLATGGDELVKHVPSHDLETAADARRAPPDGEVRLVESAHQLADFRALNLVIG